MAAFALTMVLTLVGMTIGMWTFLAIESIGRRLGLWD